MGLLERFQADTTFDSVGQFTLDDSKAREKMARYQLVADEEFLALVMQAVVASQCQAVELEVIDRSADTKSPDNTFTVALIARQVALDPDALENLGEYLFDTSEEGLPYHLLAVAGNAIEPACVTQPSLSYIDDDLHYEVVLTKPLKNLLTLVRERFQYLPCPLTFQGKKRLPIDLPDRRELQLTPEESPQLLLLRYGVLVGRVSPRTDIYFRAVVEENTLKLDASFSHVIEDEVYKTVLKRLSKDSNGLLADLARNHVAGGPDESELRKHLILEHANPAGLALRECHLFPLADRKEYTSLDALERQRQSSGKVMFSDRRFNLQLDTPVVDVSNLQVHRLVNSLFSPKFLESAEGAFKLRVLAERNKERWQSNPRPVELSPGDYYCRHRLEGQKWTAEIGFLGAPGGPSVMDILYQGHLLCTESLHDVPPSASVVVDFQEAEVNAAWTKLDGRIFRTALTEIKTELIRLFGRQDLSDPASLYPELVEYLLERMGNKKSKLPNAVLSAPLFDTWTGEGPLSLESLSYLETISLGDAVQLSGKIPTSILAPPILKFTPQAHDALVAQFGRTVVKDVRELQQHMQSLDAKLNDPQKPILAPGEDYLKCPIEIEGVTGELAIGRQRGFILDLKLMRFGVVIEEVSVEATNVFNARAIVDASTLEIYDHWTGFAKDKAYKRLIESLTKLSSEKEPEVFGDPLLPPAAARKLLMEYSYPKSAYWDRPLFETVRYGELCSLAELEKELAQNGHLLRGAPGLGVAGRTVLDEPLPKEADFLQRQLGKFPWMQAADVIEKQQQEEQFQSLEIHQEIKIPDKALLRRPLEGAKGEVALCSDQKHHEGGRVDYYVGGRLICRRFHHIPPHCVVAVESDQLTLSEDFQDVTYSTDFVSLLRENCAKLMLDAATSRKSALRQIAKDFFSKEQVSPALRKAFEEGVPFKLQGGETISAAELRVNAGLKNYVWHSFSAEIPTEEPVLRMDEDELNFVHKLFDRKFENIEKKLLEAEYLRQELSKLPTAIPRDLFSREYKTSNLQASMGVAHPGWAVGLEQDGTPAGWIHWRGLPVMAVVKGARQSKKKSGELRANVPHKLESTLWDWAADLTLAWVEQLSHQAISGPDRKHALVVLDETKREIASRRSSASSKIASILWDLPLFERVDRTVVSGLTLASVTAESKAPLTITKSSWARGLPDSAVLVQEGSHEFSILKSILGSDGLQWFESPPLLDPRQLKASLRHAVSWGLAPVAAAGKRIDKALSDLRDFREKYEKGRVETRSTFVDELRADIINLLGKELYQKSDQLFKDLQLGKWPLGPPLYRFGGEGPYRLNSLNPGVRWLLAGVGDAKTRRAARTLLVVHWVSLVNEKSKELTDDHEDEFLFKLAERMAQTFATDENTKLLSEEKDKT